MDLALLSQLKRRGGGVTNDAITAQDLADFGIADEPKTSRTASAQSVAMAKIARLSKLEDTEQNCGTCVRWLTCTTMHRAHRVSPKLSACDAYERKI